MLYEKLHPSDHDSLDPPSAASEPCSRCPRSGSSSTDFALIGIILLIGIVKKNAIMMIDFALEAERERTFRGRRIREACLIRFDRSS